MNPEKSRIPRISIWTYGYALTPPVPRDRMGPVKSLLADGQAEARLDALIWEGRLINGADITHILVVSDRPDQDLDINHRVEAELRRLDAPFSLTRAISLPGGRSGTGGAG
jgi:hypothetical protein